MAKLTKQQLMANDKFFERVFTWGSMYMWPDEREVYHINNNIITCTANGFNKLKLNSSPSFISKYQFIIK